MEFTSLRTLRCFLAVAEELHFGRAAQRLNLSQPPLTKQIQNLESRLNVRLFDRSKRSVRLTSAGTALVLEARRLLDQAESAAISVRRIHTGEAGTVRIGFISAAFFSSFQARLIRLAKSRRGIQTVWLELGSFEQVEALLKERIDLGIAHTPIELRGLAARVVAREPHIAALPAGHPLAALRTIPLSGLRDEDFVLFPREAASGYHDMVVAACYQAGFSPRVTHLARHLFTIVGLVAQGRGVSLVPRKVGKVPIPGVAFRPLRGATVYSEFSLLWSPKNNSPALKRLLEGLLGTA
ncbi:MAG TPA: LysR substrate-binding domain-containing protein [Burkholderiales bacterium]|nr:LysR substrate-binding domain-containing protein [Burkholderiales bacterium]